MAAECDEPAPVFAYGFNADGSPNIANVSTVVAADGTVTYILPEPDLSECKPKTGYVDENGDSNIPGVTSELLANGTYRICVDSGTIDYVNFVPDRLLPNRATPSVSDVPNQQCWVVQFATGDNGNNEDPLVQVGFHVQVWCTDDPAPLISAECECATGKLCPNADGAVWWEYCEHDGRCKWRPLLSQVLAGSSNAEIRAFCEIVADECSDEICDILLRDPVVASSFEAASCVGVRGMAPIIGPDGCMVGLCYKGEPIEICDQGAPPPNVTYVPLTVDGVVTNPVVLPLEYSDGEIMNGWVELRDKIRDDTGCATAGVLQNDAVNPYSVCYPDGCTPQQIDLTSIDPPDACVVTADYVNSFTAPNTGFGVPFTPPPPLVPAGPTTMVNLAGMSSGPPGLCGTDPLNTPNLPIYWTPVSVTGCPNGTNSTVTIDLNTSSATGNGVIVALTGTAGTGGINYTSMSGFADAGAAGSPAGQGVWTGTTIGNGQITYPVIAGQMYWVQVAALNTGDCVWFTVS